MGMYDEVSAICPKCSKSLVWQTKAGKCTLRVYSADAVPAAIADDLVSDGPIRCECGALVSLCRASPPSTVRLIPMLDTGED